MQQIRAALSCLRAGLGDESRDPEHARARSRCARRPARGGRSRPHYSRRDRSKRAAASRARRAQWTTSESASMEWGWGGGGFIMRCRGASRPAVSKKVRNVAGFLQRPRPHKSKEGQPLSPFPPPTMPPACARAPTAHGVEFAEARPARGVDVVARPQRRVGVFRHRGDCVHLFCVFLFERARACSWAGGGVGLQRPRPLTSPASININLTSAHTQP